MGPLARTDQPDTPGHEPIMLRQVGGVAPAAVGLPAAGGDEVMKFTPLTFLTALRRRAWAAVRWGLLLAAPVAVAIWFLLPPPKPRVSASLYTDYTRSGKIYEHPDNQISQSTQIALIRSQLVLNAAVRRPEVKDLDLIREQGNEAVDWLAKNLQVDYPYGREIVRITLVASPSEVEQAKLIVDAVKAAYLDEVANRAMKERRERLDALQRLQDESLKTLKRKQKMVRDLAETTGSTQPENVARQQGIIQEQLRSAATELATIRGTIRRLGVEEAALKAGGGPSAPTEMQIQQYVDSHPLVLDVLGRRAELEKRIKGIVDTAQPDRLKENPSYIKYTGELAKIGPELDAAKKKARTDFLEARKVQGSLEAEARLKAMRDQIALIKEHERALEQDVDSLGDKIKTVNRANLDMEAERIEVDHWADMYKKVTNAISTLRVEMDAPSRVSSLENAAVERVDIVTRKIQFASAGAVGSLALAALVVGLLEFRHRRVESADTASRATDLAVVGTVPHVPGKIGRSTAAKRAYWQSVLTESMASTQTFLQHGDGVDSLRVLLVTSAEGGEGKTSVATQLAANFARTGLRTILIDGDLRQPSAHDCFGRPNEAGLADILRGELDAAAVVQEVRPNLHLIPAGHADETALVNLAKQPGADLIDLLRTQYEVVIIDSCPILPVADTLHLARRADGVLMAVLKGRSRLPQVKEAARRLKRVRAKVLGLVVSGVPHDGYGYGYSYNYHGHANGRAESTGQAATV
jgi:capsular exopolysaccharide synthesis family protein